MTTTESVATGSSAINADGLLDGYEVVVGLEVHVELATVTKLFSGSPNRFGDEPNTNIDPVTLGLPGSLPVLNRRAVELAIRIGVALHCEVQPACSTGRTTSTQTCRRTTRSRSTTSRSTWTVGSSCPRGSASASSALTWRRTPASRPTSAARAGGSTGATTRWSTTTAPACPSSRSWAGRTSARLTRPGEYVNELRAILVAIDASDAKMEEGSMRVDANVSVHLPRRAVRNSLRDQEPQLGAVARPGHRVRGAPADRAVRATARSSGRRRATGRERRSHPHPPHQGGRRRQPLLPRAGPGAPGPRRRVGRGDPPLPATAPRGAPRHPGGGSGGGGHQRGGRHRRRAGP